MLTQEDFDLNSLFCVVADPVSSSPNILESLLGLPNTDIDAVGTTIQGAKNPPSAIGGLDNLNAVLSGQAVSPNVATSLNLNAGPSDSSNLLVSSLPNAFSGTLNTVGNMVNTSVSQSGLTNLTNNPLAGALSTLTNITNISASQDLLKDLLSSATGGVTNLANGVGLNPLSGLLGKITGVLQNLTKGNMWTGVIVVVVLVLGIFNPPLFKLLITIGIFSFIPQVFKTLSAGFHSS